MEFLLVIIDYAYAVAGRFTQATESRGSDPVKINVGDAIAVLFHVPQIMFIFPKEEKVLSNHSTEARFFKASEIAKSIRGQIVTNKWTVFEIQRTYVPGILKIVGLKTKDDGFTVSYERISNEDRDMILNARGADLGLLSPCYTIIDALASELPV